MDSQSYPRRPVRVRRALAGNVRRRVPREGRTDIDVSTSTLQAALSLGPADRGGIVITGIVQGATGCGATPALLDELALALHRLADALRRAPAA